jgi:hypothetical protein
VQVATGDLGASQRFYFPLSPTYWGLTARRPVLTGDTLGRERQTSAQEGSIRLYKLSKSFKKLTALRVRGRGGGAVLRPALPATPSLSFPFRNHGHGGISVRRVHVFRPSDGGV